MKATKTSMKSACSVMLLFPLPAHHGSATKQDGAVQRDAPVPASRPSLQRYTVRIESLVWYKILFLYSLIIRSSFQMEGGWYYRLRYTVDCSCPVLTRFLVVYPVINLHNSLVQSTHILLQPILASCYIFLNLTTVIYSFTLDHHREEVPLARPTCQPQRRYLRIDHLVLRRTPSGHLAFQDPSAALASSKCLARSSYYF